jgi:hypothetical protein
VNCAKEFGVLLQPGDAVVILTAVRWVIDIPKGVSHPPTAEVVGGLLPNEEVLVLLEMAIEGETDRDKLLFWCRKHQIVVHDNTRVGVDAARLRFQVDLDRASEPHCQIDRMPAEVPKEIVSPTSLSPCPADIHATKSRLATNDVYEFEFSSADSIFDRSKTWDEPLAVRWHEYPANQVSKVS